MNAHVTAHPAAQPVCSISEITAADEAKRFRSLAMQCRRQSHMYREWARDMSKQDHRSAADSFTKSADRYASDALWYWKRSRR